MGASRCLTPMALALVLGGAAADLSGFGLRQGHSAALAQGQALRLTLQRRSNALDVVIEGVGAQPVLQQRQNGSSWEGRLRTQGSRALGSGGQRLSLPELGIETVSLRGSGDQFELLVRRLPGQAVQDPVVSADGRNLVLTFNGLGTPQLQSGRFDLNTPGRVPQPRYAPPLRPRAVAPPLGDMAVGTMVLQNRSFVNVSGPPVTLTLNNAPAKDALMALARLGGYGFVYVGEEGGASGSSGTAGAGIAGGRSVSMAFQGESYARALNGVLLASGLQGKLDGRTLLVGSSAASKTFGPQMSKVVRLNQVTAESAAKYLGNLGATYNLTNTKTTTSGEPSAANTAQLSTQTSQTRTTTLNSESFGASSGPLLGLVVTTDSRLQTVTMVGDSQLVAVAEGYLKQIDLRQRQVALNVRILDISLTNDSQINNSFAFRSGNAFIVSDQGQLLANFGAYKPPGSAQGGLPGTYTAQEGTTPISGTGRIVEEGQFLDQPQAPYPLPGSKTNPGGPYRPSFGTYQNPLQPGVTEIDEEGKITYEAPTRFQYPTNQFFDFLVAQIQSSSTKVLASPTLIIQEGDESAQGSDSAKISSDGKVGRERSNEALVSVGTQLVTSYEVKQDINGNNFCQPVFSNAGLTFGARVDRIDDNGFITFALSPEISAAVGRPEQVANCGSINVINSRSLDTGKIRVRDGQTLILTGVISDEDVQTVTKWPILGDMPLIGQFFRSSGGNRRKNELVILVTPRIIDDEMGGTYGYGYKPSLPAARQVLSGS
ncbi:type II secretion system protein GspD [Synechococcus sp. HK01-R]|uniref:type II secretion system protein GspD n=1 Tax=Synechococcus sp. HK01-R TaxID=2751171 RepID=UPI00162A0796|nr:general secretion pathway protein GspD [Synechococcus sp. HK01-R]QNG27548.1 general secretion pathway protein GspD [Synechococcus sp. HK01-R]